VSHFAIGGGLLIAVTETLAVRRNDSEMRDLAKRSSLVLILFSTVFGAISGVGIRVVAGLISPAAISALIRNFVWGWAIEWVFFIVEIVAALVYFATWNKISKRAHVMVIWIYFIAAYLSLVIINGIVTFMLTPGKWLQTGAFWDGFFNPTYFPSLLLRTGIAILMAVAFVVWPARKASAEARPRLNRYLGLWAVVGALISYAGYRWWESALPESTRDLFLGDGALLDGLAFTRHEVMWSVALFLVLSIIFLLALPKMAKVIPLLLITIAAFSFFGSYERLREGTRKPFIIHDYMFSNGVLVDEIGELNENGMLSKARWAARVPATNSVEMGRQVFDAQCRSCHTIDGYLSIRELAPEDPDMTYSILYALYDQGEMFTALEPGEAVAMGDLNYPFMPPFVGTEEEMEALVDFIASLTTPDGEAAAKGGV
ncbi:MAG: cytochrome ubiquinol oxidase subunit I, partial [Thermoanaerobaculia bacterium]